MVVYMECTLIEINKRGLDIPQVENEPIFKQLAAFILLIIGLCGCGSTLPASHPLQLYNKITVAIITTR